MGDLTVGEGKDAAVDVSSLGCLLHLLVSGQDPSVADVVGDGVVEEHRVLGHHADVGTQRRLLHLGRRGMRAQPDPSPPPQNPVLPLSRDPNVPLVRRVPAPAFPPDAQLHPCPAVGGPQPCPGSPGQSPAFHPGVPQLPRSLHPQHRRQPSKGLWGLLLTAAPGRRQCLQRVMLRGPQEPACGPGPQRPPTLTWVMSCPSMRMQPPRTS